MRKLIVNADDIGRTQEISLGVEKAFREGLVASTSLPANPLYFDHALQILARNPGLDVGVHLHLNEYASLSPENYLQKLARQSMYGCFGSVLLVNRAQLRLIESEFRRQIEKILSHKIPISHLDGHNHIHAHPRLIALVVQLCQEYKISWMRIPKERLYNWEKMSRSAGQWVLGQVCALDQIIIGKKVRSPNHFFGISAHGQMSINWLTHILENIPDGISEIMCHVGLHDDDPPYSIGFGWQKELKVYTHFTKQMLKERYNIEIISFKELA